MKEYTTKRCTVICKDTLDNRYNRLNKKTKQKEYKTTETIKKTTKRYETTTAIQNNCIETKTKISHRNQHRFKKITNEMAFLN